VLAQDDHRALPVALIDKRTLIREALSRTLSLASGCPVNAYASVGHWIKEGQKAKASMVILSAASQLADSDLDADLALLARHAGDLPLVLISESEDLDNVVCALNKGVRAFMPSSLPLSVAVEAMRLVIAGGTYVPPGSVLAAMSASSASLSSPGEKRIFTRRQFAVVECLRRGKTNKVIAHELKMCESTVKVHVRAIMKKLNAKNRTEVAYIANRLVNYVESDAGQPQYRPQADF